MRHEGRRNRKFIGLALGALLVAVYLPAEAQQAKKVFRLGYLSNTDPADESTRFRVNSAGCYVDVKSLTHERFVNSPMLFLPYPPKRDSLLCVPRHKAVTRTLDAP